jgi:hypothetical protein
VPGVWCSVHRKAHPTRGTRTIRRGLRRQGRRVFGGVGPRGPAPLSMRGPLGAERLHIMGRALRSSRCMVAIADRSPARYNF